MIPPCEFDSDDYDHPIDSLESDPELEHVYESVEETFQKLRAFHLCEKPPVLLRERKPELKVSPRKARKSYNKVSLLRSSLENVFQRDKSSDREQSKENWCQVPPPDTKSNPKNHDGDDGKPRKVLSTLWRRNSLESKTKSRRESVD